MTAVITVRGVAEMASELIKKVLEGDVLAAARLMRDIENETADAVAAMGEIYLHTGRASVVGITGAPGTGKSTLIGSLIKYFRAKKQMTVGVVAIDPTSPYTGGAVLGDRIRMQGKGVDEDVFIRSLASRGWKGGLAKATADTIHVMDAMGKDIIFVEAVGSGQGEVDIVNIADTCVIVLNPGMGDEVQTMKAGILEAADIFAINKADREGTADVKTWLETTAGLKERPGSWKPGVILTQAVTDTGSGRLAEEILRHKEFLTSSGELDKRRRERARLELAVALESALKRKIDDSSLEAVLDDLVSRKTSPQEAAEKMMEGW
jgi:LAO/AO transport system kinase